MRIIVNEQERELRNKFFFLVCVGPIIGEPGLGPLTGYFSLCSHKFFELALLFREY